eukprot:CAMPEP_0172743840 /NCGR_PEP_ID=MMETSP1074-20121228/133359_1 /TAXON_ID=2916 /ORGANISM="Ceratium fusus, Strain PA161109" /LENGTH=167 /DNA_ID=CAMNT_0013574647 /DNA_START=64 /DNA_END=567 /DNA_ORIENTATION=-
MQLPEVLPVWQHRAVSKAWHRVIAAARMQAAFADTATLTSVELLSMSHGLCEWGGVDYVARRVELQRPSLYKSSIQQAALAEGLRPYSGALLAGTARVFVLRGTSAGEHPEEVANAEGWYTCEVAAGERSLVRVQAVRSSGISVGASDDIDVPLWRFLSGAPAIATA